MEEKTRQPAMNMRDPEATSLSMKREARMYGGDLKLDRDLVCHFSKVSQPSATAAHSGGPDNVGVKKL